jgi:hypothetical protein
MGATTETKREANRPEVAAERRPPAAHMPPIVGCSRPVPRVTGGGKRTAGSDSAALRGFYIPADALLWYKNLLYIYIVFFWWNLLSLDILQIWNIQIGYTSAVFFLVILEFICLLQHVHMYICVVFLIRDKRVLL